MVDGEGSACDERSHEVAPLFHCFQTAERIMELHSNWLLEGRREKGLGWSGV